MIVSNILRMAKGILGYWEIRFNKHSFEGRENYESNSLTVISTMYS